MLSLFVVSEIEGSELLDGANLVGSGLNHGLVNCVIAVKNR